MSIKRAALYIRVSSEEQVRHGLSLGEQRQDLLNYAETHNYAVVGVYADEGVSARKSYRSRKELQRLLRDVEAGEIDIIVMKCLDRWFRNVKDYYRVQDILDKHGVGWECSQDRYDTTTAGGRLNLHIRLAIAEDESDRTGERIRYVFNGKRNRHEPLTGRLPVGYKVEDKKIVLDEHADVARFMFRYILEGNSAYSAPRVIFEKFGYSMSYQQLRNALLNRIYVGERHGVPGFCPEIVPEDIFNRVQEMIHSRGHHRAAQGSRIYLFNRLLRCPSCGKALVANPGRKSSGKECFIYRCNHSSAKPVSDCTFRHCLREKVVEEYLLDNLQRLTAEYIYSVEHYRKTQEQENEGDTIESLNAKLGRLKDLYVDGLIDKATYRGDYEKIQGRIAGIYRQKDNIPKISPALRDLAKEKDFRTTYESLTRENKRIFWHSIISRIDFDDLPGNFGKGKDPCFRVIFL